MEKDGDRPAWIDVLAAVLLGVATIVSAFCGYQATRWTGEQSSNMATAANRQFESMRKAEAANREVLVDVATFFNFQQAIVRRDERMIQFTRAHARPEFRGQLEAWYQAAREHPDSAPSPFEGSYRPADATEADRLRVEGLEASAAAAQASARGDRWVLHTVVVTLALFFLGIATQARLRLVSRVTLGIGGVVLAAMIVSVARLPRAPRASDNPDQAALRARAPRSTRGV